MIQTYGQKMYYFTSSFCHVCSTETCKRSEGKSDKLTFLPLRFGEETSSSLSSADALALLALERFAPLTFGTDAVGGALPDG